MRNFTQKTVQLLAVVCMVVLTAFSAKADEVVITDSNFASSYPTDATYEIGGKNFCVNYVANYGNGIQMKATTGYMYNTTDLVGISSIAFTYRSGKSCAVTVYEGTAANPLSNVVEGVDGVYTFSSGMGYFSIVNGSSASYLDAITITYFETASPTVSTSTDAVAFSTKYNETETQVVALSGANLTSDVTLSIEGEGFSTETTTLTAAEIMAGADIEVIFTAPEVAGEYTGTLSIASDDFETIEVALTATAVDPDAAVEVSWTITQDDFLSGGYTYNDGEKTIDGVTLQISSCYKNNSGIQMAKSGVGYMYNTNALGEISSIVIDFSINTVNVYEGTNENPSTLVTGVDGVYTFSEGMSYFKIMTGTSYAVLNSVTINYTLSGGDDSDTTEPDEPTVPEVDGITLTLEDGNGLSTEAANGTFEQDSVTFAYKNLYYNSYGSYALAKSDSEGYLMNATEMIGLSQIVCTEDYSYYNATIYVGATANAIDTELSYTKDGDNYIYTVPDGNCFFMFVNESSHEAQIDAFQFTFVELGETVEIDDEEDDKEEDGENEPITYIQVTDITDLTSGKYVITGEGSYNFAMTSTNAGTYYGYTAVEVSSNSISNPDNSIVWDVVVATDGTITIQSADTEKYVSYLASSSSNSAYAVEALDEESRTTSWTVSIDEDGTTTLINVNNTDRYLQYNSGSRFSCYKNTQQDLRLFKEKEAATEPTISVNEELAMGDVVMDETTTATVTIIGEVLTSEVMVSIAGDEAFTATSTTYSAEEVMAGVSYEVTFTAPNVIGDYTATISISGDDFATVEVAVSASAIAPLTIADIFTMDDNETGSVATATVDYVYSSGAYISDTNGTSILAYQLTSVEVGDVLTDVAFTVGSYGGLKQIKSVSYASSVTGVSTITPHEINLADLMDTDGLSIYGGQLVTVKEVTLSSTEFVSSTVVITQNGTSSKLYNSFYIDVENVLPETANVTGYVTAYNSVPQIAPRAESDIVKVDSGETGVAQAAAATTAVAGSNGAIVVRATAATTATIYSTTGQVVAIVNVAAGESVVTLAQGLYLVSVDGAITKAVVR